MARSKTMIEGFWERFENCLDETNVPRKQIAKSIGCSKIVVYNNYDNAAPDSKHVMRFCTEYGVSLGYLMGISRDKEGKISDRTVIDTFWDRFNECIEDTGLSKNEIAKRIGCERKTIYRNKAAENRILSLLYIARFCAAYNYSPEYLLGTTTQKRAVAA